MYAIYLSDPAAADDRLVGYEVTKESARRTVRELNRAALARYGRPTPGRPVPLYFLARATET